MAPAGSASLLLAGAVSFALSRGGDTGAAGGCVPAETNLCAWVDLFASDTGYFAFRGRSGPRPDVVVQIGKTYVFDQRDSSNWFHPLGFAYYPDGAHGEAWGGPARPEVEGRGELAYKIDGQAAACADAGDTGLDCYEPEFFYPRGVWYGKNYSVELTVTQAMADKAHGGEIFYFCHIHSKMSGRIIIQNADGTPATRADGSPLVNPIPLALYPSITQARFDESCGTTAVTDYADGAAKACRERFLGGAIDTDFEQCFQAIDCQMHCEMRVKGYDEHADPIVAFVQQMIPHHVNAVNMAKILLKFAPSEVAAVEDLEGILSAIINTQNYDIHAFRGFLAGHTGFAAVQFGDVNLTADSMGQHCDAALDVIPALTESSPTLTDTEQVEGCVPSAFIFCVKVNLFVGETGSFNFVGHAGLPPDIVVQIGSTYVFDQRDSSNWFHPLGFAYYPDGAHGEAWGGPEREEVEGGGQLAYKIDGQAAACADAGETGLDCYEPEFFYPRGVWLGKKYSVELTVTQAMADKSHGGEIYYFCHIHSRMSGRIIIQNADGTPATRTGGSPLTHRAPLVLYPKPVVSGADQLCGTFGIESYGGGGANACSVRFICGALDTVFEKCLQAIDCMMYHDMKGETTPDNGDKVAVFMQQMIPHHHNAINMARLVLRQVPVAAIHAAVEGDVMLDILLTIINVQNYEVHQFRKYLGKATGAEEQVTDGANGLSPSGIVSALLGVAGLAAACRRG